MQSNISRTETDILKGVAIIMMLWLHLFLKESDIGNYSDLHFANGLSLSYYGSVLKPSCKSFPLMHIIS